MREVRIGVVGCGNISTIYFGNLARIPGARVCACADMRPENARAQGERFGIEAMDVDSLMARNDIDLVVNLTVPAAHAAVSRAALSHGKHVFSEKPLAVDAEGGRQLVEAAEARRLLIGCAPDTFLGAGGRLARRLIDAGEIGEVILGAAFVMSRGMEHWHPDPAFFFKAGGGPVFDVGPYYLTMLVNLLGPVSRVRAATATGFAERIVTAEGPRKGSRIMVETPTTALALLEFAAGPHIVFGASWDVWKHSHPHIELYGTEGSLRLPDPNFYGGVPGTTKRGGRWRRRSTETMPLGAVNWPPEAPREANHRGAGVADMVAAIRGGRPPHASGRLALHVLEVMQAIAEGGDVMIAAAERPPPLGEDGAAELFEA